MAGIEVITPKDRAAWLRVRGLDLTASVIGALFDGTHEFTSVLEVWALKTGRLIRDSEETEAMRRGRLLEPVAVQIMREDHPDWRITHNAAENVYYRDPEKRLGATPDVIVECPRRGRGVVQIKSVEAGVYRRKWLDEDGHPDAPLWIVLQAVLEAHLTGASWAAVMPLVIGYGIEAPLIEVPLDHMAGVIAAIEERAAEFWEMVAEDREPPIDFARDGAVIDRLYAVGDPGEEVDLTADSQIGVICDGIAANREAIAEAQDRLAEWEARLKAKMGTAETAHIAGGLTIRWKTYARRDPETGRKTTYRRLILPKT